MDAKTHRWLNATDAARYAGVPVAILKKALEVGEIKSQRLTSASRRRYIHTSQLDQWMSELLSGERN
jgi:DNA-binding transcriptional MerR regulator